MYFFLKNHLRSPHLQKFCILYFYPLHQGKLIIKCFSFSPNGRIFKNINPFCTSSIFVYLCRGNRFRGRSRSRSLIIPGAGLGLPRGIRVNTNSGRGSLLLGGRSTVAQFQIKLLMEIFQITRTLLLKLKEKIKFFLWQNKPTLVGYCGEFVPMLSLIQIKSRNPPIPTMKIDQL